MRGRLPGITTPLSFTSEEKPRHNKRKDDIRPVKSTMNSLDIRDKVRKTSEEEKTNAKEKREKKHCGHLKDISVTGEISSQREQSLLNLRVNEPRTGFFHRVFTLLVSLINPKLCHRDAN